ncbi:hypothetical protein GCM10023238_00820 [Streptomyces heliomycini]
MSSGPDGFTAVTEDGQALHARTVALAVGVMPIIEVPTALRGLHHPTLVTHSSHHSDLGHIQHGRPRVIGGGQAALRRRRLLAEQGTRYGCRRARSAAVERRPPPWSAVVQSLRAAQRTGPRWRNWSTRAPRLDRRLPQ